MKHEKAVRWLGRLAVAGTIATWICTVSAAAPVVSGNELPEALKDVKPATGACRRDDLLQDGSGTSLLPDVTVDLGCAVQVSELQVLLKRPNVALVDLRSAAEFQAFHIDGTLNLSQSELQSKPYWRDKTIVLLGSGKAERELYSVCAQLKQNGYKDVRVLQGGMLGWLGHDRPVAGRSPSPSQLARLSPAEFWLEGRNPDNVVLLAKEQRALQAELPFSVVLPETTGDVLKATLQRRSKETGGAPLMAVVLAAGPAVTDEGIQRLQQAIFPIPLLVYADTHDAFVRQVDLQQAIWKAQARGPKQPGCGL